MTLPTASRRKPAQSQPVACFTVLAHADPGLLPRVLEPFAKRGLVPSRLHATADGPHGDEMTIDLQVTGMSAALAEQVAAFLRGLWGVSTVLTSERRGERAA